MRQRKLLLPPFHGKAVERYREIIGEAARRDLATWPVGEPFGIRPHTQSITLEVILRAVYGLSDPARFARAQQVIGEFAKRSDALLLPRSCAAAGAGRGGASSAAATRSTRSSTRRSRCAVPSPTATGARTCSRC